MYQVLELHCNKCKYNITIETDKKFKKRPRCKNCNMILKDGHTEEEK